MLPVGKLFGIGKRMEHHLRRMGISTIGGLAGHPAELLKNAGALTANCFSGQPAASIPLRSPSTRTAGKSDLHNMTLPRDYSRFEDIKVVLLELSEEVPPRPFQTIHTIRFQSASEALILNFLQVFTDRESWCLRLISEWIFLKRRSSSSKSIGTVSPSAAPASPFPSWSLVIMFS